MNKFNALKPNFNFNEERKNFMCVCDWCLARTWIQGNYRTCHIYYPQISEDLNTFDDRTCDNCGNDNNDILNILEK